MRCARCPCGALRTPEAVRLAGMSWLRAKCVAGGVRALCGRCASAPGLHGADSRGRRGCLCEFWAPWWALLGCARSQDV